MPDDVPSTFEWLPTEPPQQLLLLMHGVGGSAASMSFLAEALRAEFPHAAIVARDAPHPFEGPGVPGRAWQWFSIQGIDDANRPARVAAAVEEFVPWVRSVQQRLGVPPPATCLAGFSQGAILALETVQAHDGLAGRVLAFSGRYATLPEVAPALTTLHLFHGSLDPAVPVMHAHAALQRLGVLQGDATLDIAEGLGHELHEALVDCALQRLRTHIPQRTWREALGAAPARRALPDGER